MVDLAQSKDVGDFIWKKYVNLISKNDNNKYNTMHCKKLSSFETNDDSQIKFPEENFQKIIRTFSYEVFPP